MEQNKRAMIEALKSVFLEQGYSIDSEFEERASKWPLSRLAIELSLAQAGI